MQYLTCMVIVQTDDVSVHRSTHGLWLVVYLCAEIYNWVTANQRHSQHNNVVRVQNCFVQTSDASGVEKQYLKKTHSCKGLTQLHKARKRSATSPIHEIDLQTITRQNDFGMISILTQSSSTWQYCSRLEILTSWLMIYFYSIQYL